MNKKTTSQTVPYSHKNTAFFIFTDFLIALFAFWISKYLGDPPRWYLLVALSASWVAISTITDKLHFEAYKRLRYAISGIFIFDFLIGGILLLVCYNFIPDYKYDISILYAIIIIFVLECALYYLIRLFVFKKIPYFFEEPIVDNNVEYINKSVSEEQSTNEDLNKIIEYFNSENKNWDKIYKNGFSDKTAILDTDNPEDVLQTVNNKPILIIHKKTLNAIWHINSLLSITNNALDDNGYVMCNCTTAAIRKAKIKKQAPKYLGSIIWFFDYIINRIMPKLKYSSKLYHYFSTGNNRALTRVEVLGRIYRAGFDVVREEFSDDRFYVIAKKIKAPITDDKPTNGILIRLKRKGKNGKIIGVYKFRTMHAYSEYLQPYIYRTEGLREGGKFADDYRVSTIGKFLRKTWLDELPMFINYFKGNMKLVGVRPLSEHYYSLYTKELQELRIKVKPGLLPPFYADMPKTLEEIEASEIKYIEAYLKAPIKTDLTYFWKCVVNIVFKGKRSN